jgi:hypothetical protein
MKYYDVYRLYINNITIYIGMTEWAPSRYYAHKYDCFYKNGKSYNNLLYTMIRKKGIIKEAFNKKVKMEILYEKIPLSYRELTEKLAIKLYLEWDNKLLNSKVLMK